jgi:hypothetical protein
VAFLLLKRGDVQQADAERWVRHAETALRDIGKSPASGTL